jgi:hypothetical protein
VIVKLFALNSELEAMRLKLLHAGSSVPHPLDGWSMRLFGQSSPPTPLNSWPLKYLQECKRLGIITDKDLEI